VARGVVAARARITKRAEMRQFEESRWAWCEPEQRVESTRAGPVDPDVHALERRMPLG